MEKELKNEKKYIAKPVYFYKEDLPILQAIEIQGENYQLLIKALLNQWKSADRANQIKSINITSGIIINYFANKCKYNPLPLENDSIGRFINPRDSVEYSVYTDYVIVTDGKVISKHYFKDLMILNNKVISTVNII